MMMNMWHDEVHKDGWNDEVQTMKWCDLLSTFSPDAASQLDVFRHDSDTLGMDCTQVGIFKQPHQIGFAGFL